MKRLRPTGSRLRCSPITGRCSLRLLEAEVGARSRSNSRRSGSLTATRAPITRRPAGRERFHQTLKRWLARQPAARSVAELQVKLDRFRAYYTGSRPHRALGRRTPVAAFGARPKAMPSLPALAVPAHYRVRRDKIDITGVVTLRHNSRDRCQRCPETTQWCPGWCPGWDSNPHAP
ncbi:MAG: integrase core domain-containing protein [Actinomycetota bacterium]